MSNIVNTNNYIQWWYLLIIMLSFFLLGWLLSKYFSKKVPQENLNNCYKENKPLKNNSEKKENTPAKTTFKTEEIRTIKKMNRSGVATTNSNKNGLNFANFGNATEANKDDLKRISGVGPFIETKLNTIGIYTFDQISKFSDLDIEQVINLIAFFPGRILREDWRGQAKILKDGGQPQFSKRVDSKDVNYRKTKNERYGNKK